MVSFDTPESDATSGIVELPDSNFDANELVVSNCSGSNQSSSRFYVAQRDGVASSPDSLLSGFQSSDDTDTSKKLYDRHPNDVREKITLVSFNCQS